MIKVEAKDRGLASAETPLRRATNEMPLGDTAHRKRSGSRCQHHTGKSGHAEKFFRALQRRTDFRTSIPNTFDALPKHQTGLSPCAEMLHLARASSDQEAIAD